jgi:hypothetical protein
VASFCHNLWMPMAEIPLVKKGSRNGAAMCLIPEARMGLDLGGQQTIVCEPDSPLCLAAPDTWRLGGLILQSVLKEVGNAKRTANDKLLNMATWYRKTTGPRDAAVEIYSLEELRAFFSCCRNPKEHLFFLPLSTRADSANAKS